jgi:hypothetical protein
VLDLHPAHLTPSLVVPDIAKVVGSSPIPLTREANSPKMGGFLFLSYTQGIYFIEVNLKIA